MRFLALMAILALWGYEYSGIWTAQFVFEDPTWTEACAPSPNPKPMPKSLRNVPRSLAQASWCWQLSQPPWAVHLVNVLLHGVVALAFGVLVYRVTGSETVGWSLGALFLLHPVAVETAGYGAGRGELIAGLGVVLACLSAVCGQWFGVLLGIGLGVLGKETAIVAVMLIPLLLVYQRRISGWLAAGIALIVLAGVFIGALKLELLPWSDRIAWAVIQSTAFVRLTALGLLPWGQTPTHDYHVAALWNVLAVIVVAGIGYVSVIWQNRLGALGLRWLLVSAAPRLLLPTQYSPFNEHQFYVPLMGLGLIAASVLHPERRYAHANRR